MSKIASMINALRQLTPQVMEAEVLAIFSTEQATVLDMNIAQLQQGKDSKGKNIKPKYTPRTVEYKKLKGDPYDRVTLKDEGDFYRGFYLEHNNSFPLYILSTDLKTGKLAEKYGSDIFGLDKQNKKEFAILYIKPKLAEKILQAIRV